MISFDLLIIKSLRIYFGNIPSICFNSPVLLEKFRYFKASTCFWVYFSKAFLKRGYVIFSCSTICFRLEGNISSPARYLHLSIFPDDNGHIFLLLCYFSFLSLILTWINKISFYIFSKRFFLEREGLYLSI